MMDPVRGLIAAYHAASLDAEGEAWGKIEALKRLEELLPDERVHSFFLSVIADPGEYDMARAHLIELFTLDAIPGAHAEVGRCIAATLRVEEDWLVRCWLAQTIGEYLDVPEARLVATERASDPDEDDTVRANCRHGLKRATRPVRAEGLTGTAPAGSNTPPEQGA